MNNNQTFLINVNPRTKQYCRWIILKDIFNPFLVLDIGGNSLYCFNASKQEKSGLKDKGA